MIYAWWLIAAFMSGATFGIMMLAIISAGRHEHD